MKNITKYIIGLALMMAPNVFSQSISLDSLKTLALENNRKIKNAVLELEASEQVKKYAFTKYFPVINANAFAMKANDYMVKQEIPALNLPIYDGNPMNLLAPTEFAYFPGMSIEALDYINMGSVSAIQPIFAGGKIYNSNKLAKLNVHLHEDKLALSNKQVLLQTEEYYWKLISLKEKRKTLDSYDVLLQSLYKDVSIAYEAGLIQKSDLLKVQLKQNEIITKRLELENGITLLELAFNQYLGIDKKTDLVIEGELWIDQLPEQVFVNHQEALLNRSEYAMLNKAIVAEELNKKLELGEHLPAVAVGVQGLYLDAMDSQETYGLAFGTVSIPISQWWGGTHKSKEHKIKIEIAQNNLEEKSEIMVLQMDKEYKGLELSFQEIVLAQSIIEETQEHSQVVSHNYDAGLVNTSKLLEAQSMLQDAHDKLLESKSNYKLKLLKYNHSIGH